MTKIWKRCGTGREDLESASAGDIVSLAGLAQASIADTIAAPSVEQPLPPGHIDPPTLRCVDVDCECMCVCPEMGLLASVTGENDRMGAAVCCRSPILRYRQASLQGAVPSACLRKCTWGLRGMSMEKAAKS